MIGYRQGYDWLYNSKIDDIDISSDDIKNYLKFKDEEPQVIAYKYISDMTEKHRDYKKVLIYKKIVKIKILIEFYKYIDD